MNRDTLIKLARETGLWEILELFSGEFGSANAEDDCSEELEKFAALVAAHEREECAKVCEGVEARADDLWNKFAYPEDKGMAMGAGQCAAAIRSRT